MVYKWFLLVHKVTCGIGVFGYVVGMLTIFGVNLIFNSKPQPWMDFALLLGFYGLYYGVLARDIAEICSDKMAAHVGVSFKAWLVNCNSVNFPTFS
jgi:RING finger protein 121